MQCAKQLCYAFITRRENDYVSIRLKIRAGLLHGTAFKFTNQYSEKYKLMQTQLIYKVFKVSLSLERLHLVFNLI